MKTVAEYLNENETLTLQEYFTPSYHAELSAKGIINDETTVEDYLRLLEEGTPAADTLKKKVKTQPNTTAQAERLALFQKLPIERQKSLLGLDDADKDNKSWGFDYAKRNRASHKAGGGTTAGSEKMHKLKKENLAERLRELDPEMTRAVSEQIADLFLETAESVSARNKLSEIVTELYNTDPLWFSLMFAEDEQVDAVELLSNRIEELESELAEAEEYAASLIDEELQRYEALEEETLFTNNTAPSRPTKRRSLDPNFTVNEHGEFLMEDGSRGQHIDPQMARYVQKLNETTRNTDVASPAKTLVETWHNQ
jgi:hypothetical protein